MPFADAPHAHHESQAACGRPRLIRVGHHAGIAQRRRLDSVLAGECGSQQQHSRLRPFDVVVQTIGEFTGMTAKGADQISVPPVEARDDIVQRRAHLVLVEGKDASQHRSRAGVLVLEPFLSGHEQPGDDPRRVGREPLRATCDEPGAHRSHCDTVEKLRACCRVEIAARVDSAPWLRFTPSARSPSNPPPVSGSHMSCPASLAPRNQAAAAATPSGQIAPASTEAARAHASASVATSIGCWSKAGATSSAPLPPTGVGDKWPSPVS